MCIREIFPRGQGEADFQYRAGGILSFLQLIRQFAYISISEKSADSGEGHGVRTSNQMLISKFNLSCHFTFNIPGKFPAEKRGDV